MKKLFLLAAAAATLGAPATAAAVTKTVAVQDDRFARTLVVVHKGDSVRWTWKGRHRHNVFGMEGNPVHFHSPSQTKGSYTKRFKKTGTYKFQCTYHAAMKMTVKVIS